MGTYKVEWESKNTIVGYIEAETEQDLINKLYNATTVDAEGNTVPGNPGFHAPWEMRETSHSEGITKYTEITTGTEKTSGFVNPE